MTVLFVLFIGKTKPSDAEAILALQRRAYRSEAERYGDWGIPPLSQSLAELQKEFDTSAALKAVTDEIIMGSVSAQMAEGIAHIGKLIVEPTAQRRGIGNALLHEIKASFLSAKRFELCTGNRSEDNIRFYRKHGYEITNEKALLPSVTLLFMCKKNAALA